MQDRSGKIWFGTRNSGIAVFDRGVDTWSYFSEQDGLSSDGILSLFQDTEGNIWAAGGAGYSVYNGERWSKSDSLGGSSVRVAYSVSGDSDGHVWLGANGGASIYNGTEWRFFNQTDNLPHRVVHDVYMEGETVWFACREGLARWDGQKMHILFEQENFRSIVSDKNGTIWFGTGGSGLYEYRAGTWKKHLDGKTVLPQIIDRSGNLWSATEGNGAYAYDGTDWHYYDMEDGLISNTVYSIAEASDGSIWFGTDKGVSIYAPE